jgi:hypothetical protein
MIVMGNRHACAILPDKRILCWGADEHGQAGASPRWTPHPGSYVVDGIADALQARTSGSGGIRVGRVLGPVDTASSGSGRIIIAGR